MSRDPLAAEKARKAELRADGVITIKPVSLAPSKQSTGFKKGGFRNAFESIDDDGDERKEVKQEPPKVEGWKVEGHSEESESDEEWGDYDPRRPTGCPDGCPGRG